MNPGDWGWLLWDRPWLQISRLATPRLSCYWEVVGGLKTASCQLSTPGLLRVQVTRVLPLQWRRCPVLPDFLDGVLMGVEFCTLRQQPTLPFLLPFLLHAVILRRFIPALHLVLSTPAFTGDSVIIVG